MALYWRFRAHSIFMPLAALALFTFPANILQMPNADAAEPASSNHLDFPDRKPEMRRLRLKHRWTGEHLDIVYKIGGAYQPEAMAEINRFMRDWRCDKITTMDPKLIDRLYDLQQAVGDRRTIRVISGYRSEGYNASLLLAGRTVDPNSRHMFGQAVDVYVPGVSMERLEQIAEEHETGGTGYYPFSGPRFVHLDTGPVRHWTEMDPAKRRKLDLPKRARKRLKLNCSLTMAEALREVPVSDAIASLPQGAATPAVGKFRKASLALPSVKAADKDQVSQSRCREDQSSEITAKRFCQVSKASGKLDAIAPVLKNGSDPK